MGQNIHLHIEVKRNGVWEHYSAPHVKRDYKLFSLMGSDRFIPGFGPKSTLAHGLPDDASYLTAVCLDYDANDLYGDNIRQTVRVMDKDGVQKLQLAYALAYPGMAPLDADLEENVFRCYINGNAISAHKGFDDVRLVYWFDN